MPVMIILLLLLFCITDPGFVSANELPIKDVLKKQEGVSCLSRDEAELLQSLNELRVINGLKPVDNSSSLNRVARTHAIDLHYSVPNLGKDRRGIDCNLHSWSGMGFWTPVCYTGDHQYAQLMWKKPKEITKNAYSDAGYENVYWTSTDDVSIYRVIAGWKKSPQHREILLETGKWENSDWKAIGVGIYKNVAVMWVGAMPDRLGPMPTCDAENNNRQQPAQKTP